MKEVLVNIDKLEKIFKVGKQCLHAIKSFNLKIYRGETLGLVGESGCGKSTVGRTILRLYEPTSGKIEFNGVDLQSLSNWEMKAMRRRMQIVFQDPYASLNPRMTVKDIVGEPIDIHRLAKGKERRKRIEKLLEYVGLNPTYISRFPHEFSGGQRQRIGLARALAVEPEFIVCDEPISALDVSIQAQVVNLFKKLQEKMGLTYLFITHNLSIVKYISDRVAVMYLGELVELASSEELYLHPLHPYTQALLAAIPIPDPKKERERKRMVLQGETPNPLNPPPGCAFSSRCPFATEHCRKVAPQWKQVKENHFVACHLIK
ncbi:MAG: ATP-binding cassette domain-containing protein [Chlamydiales bacterium]